MLVAKPHAIPVGQPLANRFGSNVPNLQGSVNVSSKLGLKSTIFLFKNLS